MALSKAPAGTIPVTGSFVRLNSNSAALSGLSYLSFSWVLVLFICTQADSNAIAKNINKKNPVKLFKNGTDVKPAITALYPNPVGNDLKLAFTIPQKGRTVYMITSISGQTIWRKEEELQSVGAYLKSWNITGIKPGAYLFTVILQGGSSTQKFIKQ